MANNNGTMAASVKPTLGLVGATVNAMALIAPGAFLWITYQMQAAATSPNGASAAPDIWLGIVVALVVAFLTAFSYAQLAKIYPEAGFASCTYFAEKAFLDSRGEKTSGPKSAARLAKLATGWSAHLFYWVYPGVMVAMMAILIGYIYGQFTGKSLSVEAMTLIAVVFASVTGYVAYKGVNGSTRTAFWINVIQLVTLVLFSGLAIWYRIANPQHATTWDFGGGLDILKGHSLSGVMVQSTLAILILVGFESCTALSAETKDPARTIPKAIILSLVIQGIFAYLLEYFAAGIMVSDKLVGVDPKGATLTGMAAAAASSAPIGDLTKLIGDSLVPGLGFGLMITMAVTVAIAVVGTTLSCMNTAMRVTCGMAEDRELPTMTSFVHEKNGTPHIALGFLIIITSAIAAVGVRSVVGLTGIALASNLGTFVLYGLTCVWTMVAFKGRKEFSVLKHKIVPVLGLVANAVMLVGIVWLNAIGTEDSKSEILICLTIAGGWLIISLVYVAITTVRKTYGMKMVSSMIRPEQLGLVVEALKDEEYITGMTVTKVKGFGRQLGHTDGDFANGSISFVSKVRIDVVVKEWDVPRVMAIIGEGARTGNVGDGKVFVIDASDAMRVRTGETGVKAI